MRKTDRAKFVVEELEKAFPSPAIPLDRRDTFTFLVAVVLSAQCTDKRVNEVTPKLFDLAPSPQAMADLDVEKIREIIRPCGLSQAKSKNIKQLSKTLVEKFGGKVPNTFEDLENLAGVGHKTASVIMSQAFGVPAFPVDTHIHRLARRWGLSDGSSVEKTERDLKKLFPQSLWGKLHLQFIYWGRAYCSARACSSPENFCPICKGLRGNARG